jgi:hypothetical protein
MTKSRLTGATARIGSIYVSPALGRFGDAERFSRARSVISVYDPRRRALKAAVSAGSGADYILAHGHACVN